MILKSSRNKSSKKYIYIQKKYSGSSGSKGTSATGSRPHDAHAPATAAAVPRHHPAVAARKETPFVKSKLCEKTRR
jgi:hypothetical protein